MGEIKAVFLDIDGTLVSFKTHRIPRSALDAVSVVRDRGIKVYIATGRPVPFIDNLDGLECDGMVTVTGAHCFTRGGEVIFHRAISEASVRRVVEHLAHGEDAYPVIFVCDDEMFVTEINEEVETMARLLHIKIPPVRTASHALGKDVLQLISFFRAARERRFMSALMPDCTSMRWHPSFTDIIAGDVDKGVGIGKVLDYEGISPDEAMAFGDGGNDVPMLSRVKYGVAMGDACDKLKSVAACVTGTVDEDGVAEALRRFGLTS